MIHFHILVFHRHNITFPVEQNPFGYTCLVRLYSPSFVSMAGNHTLSFFKCVCWPDSM